MAAWSISRTSSRCYWQLRALSIFGLWLACSSCEMTFDPYEREDIPKELVGCYSHGSSVSFRLDRDRLHDELSSADFSAYYSHDNQGPFILVEPSISVEVNSANEVQIRRGTLKGFRIQKSDDHAIISIYSTKRTKIHFFKIDC